MKIALCDDCTNDLTSLKNMIISQSRITESEIELFVCGTVLLDKIKNGKSFDIVFLDIEMHSISGIDLGKQLRKLSPKIVLIFVTAYPKYAIAGYECEAIRYLVKPCTPQDIKKVLERAFTIIDTKKRYITITTKDKVQRIYLSDLYYVEYLQRHILYHTIRGVIETPGVFSEAYKELKPYGFYQTHQGYIVNMEKIYDFKGNFVILDNGDSVMISIRKRNDVITEYAKYLERH